MHACIYSPSLSWGCIKCSTAWMPTNYCYRQTMWQIIWYIYVLCPVGTNICLYLPKYKPKRLLRMNWWRWLAQLDMQVYEQESLHSDNAYEQMWTRCWVASSCTLILFSQASRVSQLYLLNPGRPQFWFVSIAILYRLAMTQCMHITNRSWLIQGIPNLGNSTVSITSGWGTCQDWVYSDWYITKTMQIFHQNHKLPK